MTTKYLYSDVDISLETGPDGDIKVDKEIEAVKNSLRNILATIQGTRRMLPEFALNIYYALFEPVDETTAYNIGDLMLGAIEDWDDRVIIEDLLIKPKHDDNQYNVTLTFRIKNLAVEAQKLQYILKAS